MYWTRTKIAKNTRVKLEQVSSFDLTVFLDDESSSVSFELIALI
jgi:hypothetical protein